MKPTDWIRSVWYRRKFRRIGKRVRLQGRLFFWGKKNIIVGDDCKIRRCVKFKVAKSGKIVLGHHVIVGEYTTIHSDRYIEIQDGSGCGDFCHIFDADHGDAPGLPFRQQPRPNAPVIIGKNVYIGVNVTILKGVRIGDGCTIAAGAVVTKDIPPYSVAGGIPAKVLKRKEMQDGQPPPETLPEPTQIDK